MIRIYLAGPEVFCREAHEIGMAKKLLCARFHYQGLFPLDEAVPEAAPDPARIHARCVRLMHQAEGGIFNLTPFRGPSADVGTAFELGYMAALGKPVFAYTHVLEPLLDRLKGTPGIGFDEAAGTWRDAAGMSVEDFGLADNLMLDQTLAAQGRAVHRIAVPEADRFRRLDGFLACLKEAKDALPALARD